MYNSGVSSIGRSRRTSPRFAVSKEKKSIKKIFKIGPQIQSFLGVNVLDKDRDLLVCTVL